VAKLLIEHGAEINRTTTDGMSALWIASQNGHANVVELLIENNAELNAKRTTDNRTALWMAAQNGHTDVAKLLIENGADLDIKATDNSTALMPASQNGHTEIVKLLCEWGSDMNLNTMVDSEVYSALKLANTMGWKDITGILESIGMKE
jgi:ankyrin repeat protein